MTEKDIEREFIDVLSNRLNYTYRDDITDRASLEHNFRAKFEELNHVKLTDGEFTRLLADIVSSDVYEASETLREINTFHRDDGTPLDYMLVNLKDWCKNTFEVINQLRLNTHSSHHIYDVILLLNGIPLVQIELKKSTVSPKEAMKQIVDYKNAQGSSYGKTLMCFLQLFIVSNREDTWYFANNNEEHFNFHDKEHFLPYYRFADRDNKKITYLEHFAEQFLKRCTLGQMISRYMVLVKGEKKLIVMRPYQIYAVQAIVDSIERNHGNGYVWHTTGSGKTLTSFKASTLLKDNKAIKKCLFVVDRKDLDRQTRQEFNRFQEGCVEENTNTATLVERLLSDNYKDKVIVTTIQKLGLALSGTKARNYKKLLKPLRNERLVFIFDECHRSQFGENHKAIREFFPEAQLFGFTGTPIFDENASYHQVEGQTGTNRTTEGIFKTLLHAYTITHAIEDKNVLRFRVDYYNERSSAKKIDKKTIVREILDKHHATTAEGKFNALLATASINEAIDYYDLFKREQAARQADDPECRMLNVACVFSPPAEGDKDIKQTQEDLLQEKEDNKKEPEKKKKALKAILVDYNTRYGTSHRLDEFDVYYQDVQKRIKDHKYEVIRKADTERIDITIVVDMLLTGFDSQYLNTLYVDKPLRYHSLIQAFSRTNRVLNLTKPQGNIIDFRGQQNKVHEAVVLFSSKEKDEGAKEIWLVEPAPKMVEKLEEAKGKLDDFMRAKGLESTPSEVPNLKGDAARGEFIARFREVQRIKVQLEQYTDLDEEQEKKIEELLPQEELEGFKVAYLDTVRRLREPETTGDNGEIEPVEMENDPELVLFASELIDYDFIMKLLARYVSVEPSKEEMTPKQVIRLIQADSQFMDEREDLEAYIKTLKRGTGLTKEEIREGYETFKAERYAEELNSISRAHGLDEAAVQNFVADVLRLKMFDDEKLSALYEPLGLGWKERTLGKIALMKALSPLLRRRARGREIAGLDVYDE